MQERSQLQLLENRFKLMQSQVDSLQKWCSFLDHKVKDIQCDMNECEESLEEDTDYVPTPEIQFEDSDETSQHKNKKLKIDESISSLRFD